MRHKAKFTIACYLYNVWSFIINKIFSALISEVDSRALFLFLANFASRIAQRDDR